MVEEGDVDDSADSDAENEEMVRKLITKEKEKDKKRQTAPSKTKHLTTNNTDTTHTDTPSKQPQLSKREIAVRLGF